MVVVVAALLAVFPPLFLGGGWADWLERGLIFLVVSCPCALVSSVPLSFFGGSGGASRLGILVKGGNYLRNIHPLYSLASGWDHYSESVGFYDESWENWYDFCYSDQYCTGFYMKDGLRSIYHNCFCFWWKTLEGGEIGFKADGQFNSLLSNCKVTFRGDAPNTNFLVGPEGGYGLIENPFFDENKSPDKTYMKYLTGRVLHP